MGPQIQNIFYIDRFPKLNRLWDRNDPIITHYFFNFVMKTHIEFGVPPQVETRHDSNQPTSICVSHTLLVFSLPLPLIFLMTDLYGRRDMYCVVAPFERDVISVAVLTLSVKIHE